MKKFVVYSALVCLFILLVGCGQNEDAQILATTKPVYQFTASLCQGTPLQMDLLISENVSCLHDYTLQVRQMRKLESAELIVMSGAGFEDFLSNAIPAEKSVLDSSTGISLNCGTYHHDDGHHHDSDPHIWLSISNAKIMAENIYVGLCEKYPQYAQIFTDNLNALLTEFAKLETKAQCLNELSYRDIVTFHDGFSYLAESFDLHIVKAIEEESGAEASAQELIEIIEIIDALDLPAIFTEVNGSTSAPSVIQAETNVKVFSLDMALSERDYFEAMEHNIETLKEALE